MITKPNVHGVSFHKPFSRILIIPVFIVGVLVLTGWIFDILVLKNFAISQVPMQANTAISFILASVSLWLLLIKRANQLIQYIAKGCALIVLLIGLLTLIEYLFAWNAGIDQLLFQATAEFTDNLFPDRMSPLSALNFLLIGIAILLMDIEIYDYYCPSQYLALIVAFISFLVLIGYMYGQRPLYGIASYTKMALHTSLIFFILCAGVLSLYPNRGIIAIFIRKDAGGVLIRRLLGVTIFTPPFLGWLGLLGQTRGFYTIEFGLSLFVVLNVVVFAVLIWQSAIVLDRKENERDQLEKKLQESHSTLEALMKYIPEGITIADAPDVRIRMISNYGVMLTGRSRENLEDISAEMHVEKWDIFHSDGTTQATPEELPLTRATQKGELVMNEEWIVRRPNGEEITILCNAGPILGKNSTIIGGIIAWRDITKRKRMEKELRTFNESLEQRIEERTSALAMVNEKLKGEIKERKQAEKILRESENKYRLLLENLPQRVFYKDKNSMYISCNENFASDFHIKPDEVFGKTDYDFFPGELAAKYRSDDKRIVESGQRESREERYIKDGNELIVQMVKTPIRDEKGAIVGILGSALDITEKVALERETERTRRLVALGELAAGVGHEINNPITGVINCAQILFNKSREESKERDLARRIMKEGDRIAKIVHSLLSIARPGSNDEKSIVGIHEILPDVLTLTGAQLRKDGIKLRLDIPGSLPKILANPQLIQQVFLNLINNARYALNQKYAEAHDNKILEILGEETMIDGFSYVKITFYDHGTGIPASIKDKVMDPFFTTKPISKGTGLGLCISHTIISDHGGKCMIDSVEGEFTKIAIILPAKILEKSRA